MRSRWSDDEASRFVERYAPRFGEDLALRTYTARLLGAEPSLVLHGGGNTSVKGRHVNLLGESVEALFVKASGLDMASIEPEGHPGLDLARLRRLRRLEDLDDEAMRSALRARCFDPDAPTPSIETLAHAFLPQRYIDHTHAGAILALTNREGGEETVREALGEETILLGGIHPGFRLAAAAAAALEARPGAAAMVWMRHGIVTWGETAREAYEAMISVVSRAEGHLERLASAAPRRPRPPAVPRPEEARAGWQRVAPVLRGLLAPPAADPGRPRGRVVVTPLADREVLELLAAPDGKRIALTPPLTGDHIIRTRPFPLWVEEALADEGEALRGRLASALEDYARDYRGYARRHGGPDPWGAGAMPRVVLLPGIGCACAGGDAAQAAVARDITAHTLAVKTRIAASGGTYRGLDEADLHAMEFRAMQQAKIERAVPPPPLGGRTALVTGAAGAIGSGICRVLLEHGCHVAATDLPGERLDDLVEELRGPHGERILGTPLDVTDPASVARAFETVIARWGGIDLVVANAGAAHVSSLAEMDLETFRRLERINVEGTLLVLAQAGRHFELQGIGGDVVLVSTKNVFAPGARFGAYSATKAAAHQLARIASLEMAPLGVRVNMVAPDAVFSEGKRRSGLWEEVGPDRMRARGLDREQLEEFYRGRNLLQARVTATHVASAVLFFASRRTPTTGATLPVDGGLPDATPR